MPRDAPRATLLHILDGLLANTASEQRSTTPADRLPERDAAVGGDPLQQPAPPHIGG